MREQTTDISVILVGLNACDFIRGCVESLRKARWRGYTYEIIYIDNGSKDQTLEMLKDTFPEVKVIANSANMGYCKAANQGAEIAGGRYYYFLNDDTVVLDDAIPVLAEFLDTHSTVGVIGSRLFYPDMTEQWSGRMFPTIFSAFMGRRSFLTRIFPNARVVKKYLCKDQLHGSDPFEVDWVSAAAMMVPRKVFDAVNGLAEDYYYWHESVFCDRVAKIGGKTFLHPLSKIIHFEGKGSGARPYPVKKFHILNFHQGALRCYCEHYELGLINPVRWLVGTALFLRANLLLLGAWLIHLKGLEE